MEDAADENKALREDSISCLSTCIFNVISLRLSEGFTIRDSSIKGVNQLEVHMVLPWRLSKFLMASGVFV